MKKILLSLIISAFSVSAYSQTIAKDTVELIGFFKDGTIRVVKDSIFNNSTADPLTVTWTKSFDNLSQGWSGVSVCDPNNCYTFPQTLTQKSFTIAPQKWGLIYVDVIANANAGNSPVYVTITTSVGDMTYKFQSYPTSVKDFENSNFVNISPNPATNFVNIALNDKSIAKLNVVNVIGRKIASFDVDANYSPIRVPLENVTNGVYFLQFADARGKLLGVKKVTKQ